MKWPNLGYYSIIIQGGLTQGTSLSFLPLDWEMGCEWSWGNQSQRPKTQLSAASSGRLLCLFGLSTSLTEDATLPASLGLAHPKPGKGSDSGQWNQGGLCGLHPLPAEWSPQSSTIWISSPVSNCVFYFEAYFVWFNIITLGSVLFSVYLLDCFSIFDFQSFKTYYALDVFFIDWDLLLLSFAFSFVFTKITEIYLCHWQI